MKEKKEGKKKRKKRINEVKEKRREEKRREEKKEEKKKRKRRKKEEKKKRREEKKEEKKKSQKRSAVLPLSAHVKLGSSYPIIGTCPVLWLNILNIFFLSSEDIIYAEHHFRSFRTCFYGIDLYPQRIKDSFL